jgi:hypothetical protein
VLRAPAFDFSWSFCNSLAPCDESFSKTLPQLRGSWRSALSLLGPLLVLVLVRGAAIANSPPVRPSVALALSAALHRSPHGITSSLAICVGVRRRCFSLVAGLQAGIPAFVAAALRARIVASALANPFSKSPISDRRLFSCRAGFRDGPLHLVV